MTSNGFKARQAKRRQLHRSKGFSLIELLVATAVFAVVAGTAFTLFGQHVKIATEQKNLSGVNIGLRNAMSQLEIDLAGSGGNLLAGVPNAPPFYFSVLINNNVPGVATNCGPNTSTWSYPVASACFDSITLISPNNSFVKPCGAATAPILVLSDPGNGIEGVGTAATMFGDDPSNPGNNATQTADAACYNNGDEILVVQFPSPGHSQITCGVNNTQFNFCLNAVTLTKDAKVSGNKIQLQHNPTGGSNDPLGLIYNPSGSTNFTNALGNGFTNGAYIINLGTGPSAVTYAIQANPNNANDPQLMRCPGTSCTTTNEQVLTDQVIGFKVGADLWNNAASNATDLANYIYNPAHYCSDAVQTSPGVYVNCTANPPAAYDPYDFTLVRAIRVSMVARTTPLVDPTAHLFKNGFDGGPYLVQQAAIVVDLRNLSNVDTTN